MDSKFLIRSQIHLHSISNVRLNKNTWFQTLTVLLIVICCLTTYAPIFFTISFKNSTNNAMNLAEWIAVIMKTIQPLNYSI